MSRWHHIRGSEDVQIDVPKEPHLPTHWEAKWKAWPHGLGNARRLSASGDLMPDYPMSFPEYPRLDVDRRFMFMERGPGRKRPDRRFNSALYQVRVFAWGIDHVEMVAEYMARKGYVADGDDMVDGEAALHIEDAFVERNWEQIDLTGFRGRERQSLPPLPPGLEEQVLQAHLERRKGGDTMRHYKNRLTSEELAILVEAAPEVLDVLGHDPRKLEIATNAFTNVALRLEAEYRMLYALQKVEFERALRNPTEPDRTDHELTAA